MVPAFTSISLCRKLLVLMVGSKYGLSSRFVTKIPVDLDVLHELCD